VKSSCVLSDCTGKVGIGTKTGRGLPIVSMVLTMTSTTLSEESVPVVVEMIARDLKLRDASYEVTLGLAMRAARVRSSM